MAARSGSRCCCRATGRSSSEINRRLLDEVRARFPGDDGRAWRASASSKKVPTEQVRMANLAIVGSHSTNGVAAIHSELLRTRTVRDLAEMFPSGSTTRPTASRRAAGCCYATLDWRRLSPRRSAMRWITDLTQLATIEAARRRRGLSVRRSAAPSARPKRGSRTGSRATTGEVVDPDTIFDCQVKRIHEYKRQLLNALHIVVLYNRLRDESQSRLHAAHVLLRRQSRSGLCAGQAHHQVHQQPGRHHQRRSRCATGA